MNAGDRCPRNTNGDGDSKLQPWQRDMLDAAMKLGPDERLIVDMPRSHAHPIWTVIGLVG